MSKTALRLFCGFVSLLFASTAWAASMDVRPFTENWRRQRAVPLSLAPLYNGSFEYSSVAYHPGWGTYNLGGGAWVSYTGTATSAGGYSCNASGLPVPTDANRAAITQGSGIGMHILYQDVVIPQAPSMVTADVDVINVAGGFSNAGSLDHLVVPNQHFRADVLSPIVAITDTGAGVIRNLFITNPGMPPMGGYKRISAALPSATNPDTYARIRFADVSNQGCLFSLVDNVKMARIVAGNFNGDLKGDVFWRNGANGQNVLWLMNGTGSPKGVVTSTVPDTNYKIAGLGDLDADGWSDVVWRRNGTGEVVVWLMDGWGTAPFAVLAGTVADPNWRIEAVADVDGDAMADLVWRKITTGEVVVWLMNGEKVRAASGIGTVPDLNWSIVKAADLNNDAKADLIWRNGSTGANAVWFMNGFTMTPAVLTTVADTNWKIVTVLPYFDMTEFVWRNDATGQVVMWLHQGANLLATAVVGTVADLNWRIEAVTEFQAPTVWDFLWRNIVTGQTAVWQVNGPSVTATAFLPALSDLNWSAVGPR